MTTLNVVLTVLLIMRVTRLIVADAILDPVRVRLLLKLGEESRIMYLLTCSWCMSVWVGAGISAAAYWYGNERWWTIMCMAGAASWFAGIADRWLDPEDEE